MLIYLVIALVGTVFLVITAVLGEVFDFFDSDADVDGGVSPLSGKVLATAMTAFGAGGMIGQYYDFGAGLSALLAVVSALFLGAAAWWLISVLQSQTGSTDVLVSTMLGRSAFVTVGIPSDSVGEVQVSSVSGSRRMIARSASGVAIPAGTSVRVVELNGAVLIVEALNRQAVAVPEAQGVEG